MKPSVLSPHRALLCVVILTFCGSFLVADSLQQRKEARPSTYAPMSDLTGQIESFVEDLGEDLEDREEFSEDRQKQVSMNANTLIVLGQMIGMHDADHEWKKAAPFLVRSATEVADNAEDFDAAVKSFASLTKSLTSTEPGDVDWEPTADLAALMQQVPIVNNRLRRGVTGRRFERMVDKCAGSATTLAAIAQASIYYTDYCIDEEDEAKWAGICIDMRDAAANVNAAVRRKDKSTAVTGLEKLVETCDACHHAFRD